MRWSSRELEHRDVVVDGDDIPIITIISMLLCVRPFFKKKES